MDSDTKYLIAIMIVSALALAVYQFGFVSYDGFGFMVPGVGGYFFQYGES